MNKPMNKRLVAILLMIFGAFFSCSAAKAQDVVMIVNNGVKASSANAYDIHSVFTGEKSSLADGSHVTPVTLKAGAVHEAFLKAYVGKGDAAYRTSWRSLVFSGQGSMPKTFDSESALVDYVATTPGAIGYVGNETPHDKAKTLAVK